MRIKSTSSGAEGTAESHGNGWWSITWDGGHGPVEVWAPLTRGLVEVVE